MFWSFFGVVFFCFRGRFLDLLVVNLSLKFFPKGSSPVCECIDIVRVCTTTYQGQCTQKKKKIKEQEEDGNVP